MVFNYDVIVVGAGHAGCEAAAASAKLGAKTCLITMDMNKIAQMSCNPAIGGIAKGQIVREIDALGGYTGIVTDRCTLQFRMLNRSKGPAMWSPRAQCDRAKYIWTWREILENTPNLNIWQDQVRELVVEEEDSLSTENNSALFSAISSPSLQNAPTCLSDETSSNNANQLNIKKKAVGVKTYYGAEFRAKCVIITAGTFLNGLMHIGRVKLPGGRCSEPASLELTESITRHGIRSARMKTGTPVRIDKRSVDFSLMERQEGDHDGYRFSYLPNEASRQSAKQEANIQSEKQETSIPFSGVSCPSLTPLPCWITYTNEAVHEVLRSGFADSPLYNGQIQSIGPRYCPSIETKLHTFPDKDQHMLFLEPEGETTNEMYLNGFSSSLPMEVQLNALRQIPAFRNLEIYRPGYAIEYDFFDPTQLNHSLESKIIDGLFFAGQVNGTTGYEEAAGQGLMAGINAAIKASVEINAANKTSAEIKTASKVSAEINGNRLPIINNGEPLVLKRNEAYIGVLIDDLVTKGVDEPYRMFTSRAEYRILLRQDDADMRLTERSYQLGLATQERYDAMLAKKECVQRIITFADEFSIKPSLINDALTQLDTTPLHHGCKLSELISRPQITIANIALHIKPLKKALDEIIGDNPRRDEIIEAAEIQIKYRGYISREQQMAEKMLRLENIKIKGKFDYPTLQHISIEARQKLQAIQPKTLAQASRIPGVSPSDINVLLVLLGR